MSTANLSGAASGTPASNGNGVPWQALATALLGIVIAVVSWVFVNTTDDIKKTVERQADDIKAIRSEMASNHLELVRAVDGVDKNVTLVSGKVDLVAAQVGVKQPLPTPAPVPAPEPKK